MNRTIELIRLIKFCGQIDGRKKLQKIVHILKEAGHPFNFHYGFHFHGPFSAELKGEIDSLAAEALIIEQAGATDSGVYQQYSYSASPAAVALLERAGLVDQPSWKSLADRLNAKSAQELEAISTVVYLTRLGSRGDSLGEQFKRLKPKLAHLFDPARTFAETVLEASPRSA